WQESDQVLAGILTDFGAKTGAVAFGGRGEFDGRMTGLLRRPRVEGVFTGEDMRAWDTLWGDGRAHIVVQNSYVTVTDGVVHRDGSEIRAEGLFSLGYPRRDGGDEIDARLFVTRRDLDSLRHAFKIDDYPVSGALSGEFHLTGRYEGPDGFGSMTIEDGTAYDEPFERATAGLRFEGNGVRLDNAVMTKAGGSVDGAAFIGWNGTYSFNAVGRRVPMEETATFHYPSAQPTGLIEFTAGGNGTFDTPRYDVRFRIADLFVGTESVGQVTGLLTLRGEELSGEIDAASPRLNVTGTGRIGLAITGTSDLTFRFHDSSLDPYVRLFVPKLSPYTTAVANGSVRLVGTLSDIDRLLVDATVDRVDMRLFDYALSNAGPIRLVLDRNVARVEQLRIVGEDTRLDVGGTVQLHDETIAIRATGEANLGILQGFFRDVRGAGRARLAASVDGPLYEPVFSGSATIADGRIRHFSLPNSLEAINGVVQFDRAGIQLDDLTATMGGGRIQFGGRIGLQGYLPGELTITLRGEDVRLRYPEGVRSTVDADLTVTGNVKAPTVGGQVTVKSAVWNRRVDPTAGLLDFGGGREADPTAAPAAQAAAVPVRLDLEVVVPSTLRIENNLARLVASADLQLRGTYEKPV
ncbi:MAG: translocation/assembly module TamB domain-containing protein, partial [Vicinamibacterales bacterium]